VVAPGDTLNKLAGRFLGKNTAANRAAIVALNPSLKQNPNNIVVGRTLMIPPAKAVAKATPAPAAAPAKPVAAAPPAAAPTPAGPQYWYTVKEDDNLWRIAKTQLGDGQAVAAIKELNKDVLKGRDIVHPNMRLRLPAKPIASTD
jgi:nucleoid-associated protein YgaU